MSLLCFFVACFCACDLAFRLERFLKSQQRAKKLESGVFLVLFVVCHLALFISISSPFPIVPTEKQFSSFRPFSKTCEPAIRNVKETNSCIDFDSFALRVFLLLLSQFFFCCILSCFAISAYSRLVMRCCKCASGSVGTRRQ